MSHIRRGWWRPLIVLGVVIGVACHLGDLVSPGPAGTSVGDTTVVGSVRSLTLAPADTTLTAPGDSVCLRWSARDSADAEVPDVTPSFTLALNPANRLALAATPGCVVAVSVGSQGPGRVRAAVSDVTADALVRATP